MLLSRFPIVITSLAPVVFAALLSAQSAPKPKLVVGIVIDQFRYDYLTRFRGDYHGGIDEMLTHGADFTNAFYAQVPTVTAVGHSIFMSGAMPAVSGIVSNWWYDRDEKNIVTSVCDWAEKTVGGAQQRQEARCTDADPASPRRLLVSTVGDELRTANNRSKVIGISIKARGAILPSGHRAAGAYWLDDVTGNFVTSTFYMNQLPQWATAFNDRKLPAKYVNRKWEGFPDWTFRAKEGSSMPYENLPASPWGNELIEQFTEAALAGEQLGQRGVTDLLTVSFSSNDYVGHRVGPDAPEVRDMAIRTDQLLAKLFHAIDEKIGLQNVIVVLSADHGVASKPSIDIAEKMPGGYVVASNIEHAAESVLEKRFGQANWLIPGGSEYGLCFDPQTLESAKAVDGKPPTEEQLYRVVKSTLLAMPQLHIARVYSREQLENGVRGDFIAAAEVNGYYPRHSPDVAIVLEPGYMRGTSGATHFSPYAYDRHVPVLFMGPGIKPGRYDRTVMPNDIAPTLATMLDIQTPSGSSGSVLTELLLH